MSLKMTSHRFNNSNEKFKTIFHKLLIETFKYIGKLLKKANHNLITFSSNNIIQTLNIGIFPVVYNIIQTNYMIKYFLLTLLLLGAVYAQGNQCNNSCDPYNRCDFNTTAGFYECQAGTVSYNGSCYLCDLPGCTKCYQDNFCIQFDDTICSPGQSVDIYGESCISCNVNNCQRCDTPNHCARCDYDYTQVNGACSLRTRTYRCPSWCNACQKRGRSSLYCPTCTQIYQKPNPSQNECYNCGLTNCRYCDSKDSCTVCMPGYRKQAYWVSCNGSNSEDSQRSGSDRSDRSGRGRNLNEDKRGREKKFRCIPI